MKFVWILLVLSMSGCAHCERGVTPDPEDSQLCPEACAHLQELGCPEGDPLPDGTTCSSWCVYTQEQGHWLNLPCILSIESCDELEECEEPLPAEDS
jgi:hypothetical protein